MQVQTKQLFEKKLELILEFYDHFDHFPPKAAPHVTYDVLLYTFIHFSILLENMK